MTTPDLSARDEAISIYSDMYKDRYNVRPRWIEWDTLTDDDIRRMTDDLAQVPFADD
jgi:hypothetical protein